MKYFVDKNIWYQGKLQEPRKVELIKVIPDPNGKTALCYDRDGNDYTLPLCDIIDEED